MKLVIVDDHVAVRTALGVMLEQLGFRVVATAGDATEGARAVAESDPDVAIVDLGVPGGGDELCRSISARDPSQALVLYTGVQDETRLRRAADCGARGFVLKSRPARVLVEAVRAVASGGTYLDPDLAKLFLRERATSTSEVLTARERQILGRLADGERGSEIAELLGLSPETVRTHVRNAMAKLEAKTRTHAVAIALRSRSIGDWEES